MNEIPLLGWVCLGSIVFMVIGLYLSLLAAWRKKDQNSQSRPMQGTQIINTLRKPWAREDAEWEKLHQQTEKLRINDPSPPQK
jgi:hypothetical protein